ncbi:MAG: DUF6869 domain-containing protein [Paracoccaceae bacterium]
MSPVEMAPAERARLLDAYVDHWRWKYGNARVGDIGEIGSFRLLDEREARAESAWWAVEALMKLGFHDPAALLPFVLDMAERDDPEDALIYFAAGPAENYLRSPAARDGLPAIEAAWRRSARMRELLAGVWIEPSGMDAEVFARCRALGCHVVGEP